MKQLRGEWKWGYVGGSHWEAKDGMVGAALSGSDFKLIFECEKGASHEEKNCPPTELWANKFVLIETAKVMIICY